ncbi:MAG: WYL domain-containing protein [Clostridiales bacterium]|nr:WYL domain-containing protein [Clostridiales bacterium]
MPKNDGSKDKILYLLKILEECTDEDHGLTMPEIQKKMIYMMHLEEGQEPDRKTIKAHIDSLSDFFDYDIGMEREGAKTYYKMLSREFDLQDLQFIADAVATSKFLTEKKTKELIDKLGTLCSSYQRSSLSRKVTTANRIKSMNDKIHYNLNSLNLAISEDKKVTFRYFSYDEKKERKFNKSSYKVSPWAMIYADDNYYLLALDGDKFKHFRVDRMLNVSITEEARKGEAEFKKKDMADYQKYTFNMYGGEIKNVTLQFQNRLMNVAIDRFGKEIIPQRVDANHFKITVPIAVSDQSFGWVVGLGKGVKILEPDDMAERLKNYLCEIQKMYE